MLTHEAIHLMVAQATANPFNSAPRWLDEGLAEYFEAPTNDARGCYIRFAAHCALLSHGNETGGTKRLLRT
jgi:hypothetical protein